MNFFAASAPLGVAAEAASATAAVCESSGAVVCPKPRHTLASTAALFLPDKSSPILLAPSEIEIQSDPHYYTFGSQLVAALVLFSLAYSLAHIILGSVRRRERKAKQQWKEERKQQRAKELQGRIPTLHPTLYHVAPALSLTPTPFSLDLSEPLVSASFLSRTKQRVRSYVEWFMYMPVRIRRRLRIDKNTKQAKQQAAQARRFVASPSLDPSKSTFRQRISRIANITSFINRAKQAAAADSPRSATSDSVIDDSITLNLILGSFTSALPSILPWTISEEEAAAAPTQAPKPIRRGSITDRLSEWTAALSVNMAAMQASPPPTYTPLDRGASSRMLSPQHLPPVVEETAYSHSPPPRADASSPAPFSDDYLSSPYFLSNSSHADSFPLVENEREFLTYSLATFVLAVGLVWLELLVLSVLASTSLHGVSLNQTYAFSWCTHSLVSTLWLGTVWLSSISLFVLAPFGFLYYEAEGLGGRKGFVSRVAETLLVLSAFTVLLYGSFHLLQSLLDRGGLLHPFTYTYGGTIVAQMNLPLEEFSIYDLFESSFGVGTAWNVFLRSSLNPLLECLAFLAWFDHAADLVSSWIYRTDLRCLLYWCPSRRLLPSPPLPLGCRTLNLIKLELSTAERKWMEKETEWRRSEQYRPKQVKESKRAIGPSQQPRVKSTNLTSTLADIGSDCVIQLSLAFCAYSRAAAPPRHHRSS